MSQHQCMMWNAYHCFFTPTLLVAAPIPTLQVNGFHPLEQGVGEGREGRKQLRKKKSIQCLRR